MKLCKCGCGKELPDYYKQEYLYGHKPKKQFTYKLSLICQCGCGEMLPDDSLNKYVYKRYHVKRLREQRKNDTHPCACGCETLIPWNTTWYQGHKVKEGFNTWVNKDPVPCLCGCGELVKPPMTYIKGHHNNCELNIQKRNQAMKKHRSDPEWKDNLRKKSLNFLDGLSVSERDSHFENSRLAMQRSEVKEKISTSHKNLWKDPEYREKMYSVVKRGSDHHNWKGGIAYQPYCCSFTESYKEEIRSWDGEQCRNPYCWGTAERLAIHHIDYDKMNCHPSNMITICTSCNSRANRHRSYWRRLYARIRRLDIERLGE